MVYGFECSLYVQLFALLGLASLLSFFSSTIYNWLQFSRAELAKYFLPNENHTLTAKYGKWAVITGSTDGIGKQYAMELAARDLNIVLISRNEEKLKSVAQEIVTKYSVKTKIIVADFSKGKEVYKHIEQELQGISVGILVNNVGIQYNYPKYVGEVNEDELWGIININIGAATMMTRLILPQMRKNKKGAIVNLSSGSELMPLPLMTLYAATKAYMQSFTKALRYEYSKYGITVQQLSPMYVSTKLNKFSDRLKEKNLLLPDAELYAKHAVNTLGKVDHSTGYWWHGIQYFFVTIAPIWVRTHIGAIINKEFRKEYMKNKQ